METRQSLKTDFFSEGSAPLEQGFEVALPEDLEVVQVGLDVLGSERKRSPTSQPTRK